ncbi:hypothetical protein DM860_001990 [Cuscuta australis]|uniref:Uncharacterized protein n=1 Tax=Cuscuta australis TaxID=267555 RepID=A0A328DZC5_9ASTE|nr:hypothetical protein DM860_001990 [Cuscuta australis]
MANKLQYALLIAGAICLASLLTFTDAAVDPHFQVIGTVYCDTCRAKFVTRVSERMPGAKVRLECYNNTDGKLTYSADGETDSNGVYNIDAVGEHQDEFCGVKPVKSSKDDCTEIIEDGWAKDFTRVTLTTKNGIADMARNVNPILYLKDKPIAACPEVFKELRYIPGENQHP